MCRGSNERSWSGLRGWCRVVVLASLFCVPLSAERVAAKVYGYGDKSCMDVLQDFDTPEVRSMYLSWAQGYFSALSYREGLSDFTKGVGNDPRAMQNWLLRYCEMRNSKRYYEAVDAFVEELIKFAGQKTR